LDAANERMALSLHFLSHHQPVACWAYEPFEDGHGAWTETALARKSSVKNKLRGKGLRAFDLLLVA
jgi:hypothetical protein